MIDDTLERPSGGRPSLSSAGPASAPLATFSLPAGAGPEPITAGFALRRGALTDTTATALVGPDGALRTLQAAALSRWSDGSVRWLLCDFVAGPEAGEWRLVPGRPLSVPPPPPLPAEILPPGTALALTDAEGRVHAPVFEAPRLEGAGPVRTTLCADGRLGPLHLALRVTRWTGRPEVRLELTARNPRAARHPGGCWDLGDPGSVRLRDLSLTIAGPGPARWRPEPGAPFAEAPDGWQIFQASSGGERWRCVNHVNRDGVVPLRFRGWRTADGHTGHRALPELAASDLRVTLPCFWQEFPKVLAFEGGALRVGLWPHEHGDLHEIQGGEQKTFILWMSVSPHPLEFVHAPRRPVQAPRELAAVLPHFGLPEHDAPEVAERLALIVDAQRGFAARREQIDEYGWRNWGDLYADHEAVRHPADAPEPFVSHYNNQYDCVDALLLQFLRTGDRRWWDLAEPLARHVIDVDLYHTDEDRACYNGGLFWHTDHYLPAATATHRCFSRRNGGKGYGGGHSDEHDYPSGLLLYHYLTGDPRAAEAVIQLAAWARDMDDGTRTVFGLLDPGPTGLATATYTPDYQGPGRGAGNSVNALCDAFALTGDRRWLDQAEAYIRRVVHPRQDLAALDLLDAERRWSYVVFLKYLIKYLELKDERGERDFTYAYARDTLLHYATWMVAHERPSTTVPEKLEFVTETWPAQDLRKAQVVEQAAAWAAPEVRPRWFAWAETTFERALRELSGFPTQDRCRPLVLTIHPGISRAWARAARDHAVAPHAHGHDFGAHAMFVPQKQRVKALLRTPGGLWSAVRVALRPSTWRRLLRPW